MTETQIKQVIGQLEASIDKAEPYTTKEEFEEYCDNIQSCITRWKVILKQIKERKEDGTQS